MESQHLECFVMTWRNVLHNPLTKTLDAASEHFTHVDTLGSMKANKCQIAPK
jgi:hypothetical protein